MKYYASCYIKSFYFSHYCINTKIHPTYFGISDIFKIASLRSNTIFLKLFDDFKTDYFFMKMYHLLLCLLLISISLAIINLRSKYYYENFENKIFIEIKSNYKLYD